MRSPVLVAVSLLLSGCTAVSTPAPAEAARVGPAELATVAALGPSQSPRVPAQAAAAAARLPHEGDRVLDLRAYYGLPILQKSFFWDGNGEVDQFGLRARHLWYESDSVALGCGLSVMNFLLGGSDVQAAEVDAIGHFHVYTGEGFAVFVETTGGFLQATDAIPPGGTEWNFTFSGGSGVDVPVGDGVDLVTGATYHHISNALGHQNPRNPSQNEADLWIGVAFRF